MHEDARQERLRKALGRYPTGVTIVAASRDDGEPAGLTVNTFTSVSLDPPLILWCLSNSAGSRPVLEAADHFGVSILERSQDWISTRLAQPTEDKFAGVPWYRDAHGVPLIDGAVATITCRRFEHHPAGDHIILIGEVIDWQERGGDPLVYLGGAYRVAVRPG